MHCPNSMLVGGLGLKSYQRENSECFDLFFGLRENRVVATVLETFFSTTNGSFKDVFTKCDELLSLFKISNVLNSDIGYHVEILTQG